MIPSKLKEKNFQKPWHAQIFAITVSLSENKVFEWCEFSDFLAHEIKMDNNQTRNGSDDYFYSWVKALEKLLIKKKLLIFQEWLKLKTFGVQLF